MGKKINSIASTEVLFRENMVAVKYLKIYQENGVFYFGETKKNKLKFIGFNQKMLDYFLNKDILQMVDEDSYRVNVNNLNKTLFDAKKEVLEKFGYYSKLEELRYTTQKKSITSLLEKFIKPSSNDEKNFMISLIGKRKPTTKDEFNFENLIAFFRKGSKTEHKKIRLKIDKTWAILAQYLSEKKGEFLIENNGNLFIKIDSLNEVLKKHVFFKKTLQPKRKVPREYSLPLKDMTDKCFIVRRKDDNGNIIYQYLFAKNSTRGFVDGKYIHKGDKNIIPAALKDYKIAFSDI